MFLLKIMLQPLLPPSVKTDSWVGSGKSSVLHSPSSEYYDVEDKADGLTIHRNGGLGSSNGIVKIDIPAPLREEPRFPKEKWKTFIGTDMFVSVVRNSSLLLYYLLLWSI